MAALAGLFGLADTVLTAHFWFTDSAVLTVYDSGYHLYLVGYAIILSGSVALAVA